MDTSSGIRVYGVLGRGGAIRKNHGSSFHGGDHDTKEYSKKDHDAGRSGKNGYYFYLWVRDFRR